MTRWTNVWRASRGGRLTMVVTLLALAGACGAPESPPSEGAPATPAMSAAGAPAVGADEAVGAVTDEMLRDGHRARTSTWPTYGGDWGQTRYSPLTEIRRENVARLRPAW